MEAPVSGMACVLKALPVSNDNKVSISDFLSSNLFAPAATIFPLSLAGIFFHF